MVSVARACHGFAHASFQVDPWLMGLCMIANLLEWQLVCALSHFCVLQHCT